MITYKGDKIIDLNLTEEPFLVWFSPDEAKQLVEYLKDNNIIFNKGKKDLTEEETNDMFKCMASKLEAHLEKTYIKKE